jgi:hypothetical protein
MIICEMDLEEKSLFHNRNHSVANIAILQWIPCCLGHPRPFNTDRGIASIPTRVKRLTEGRRLVFRKEPLNREPARGWQAMEL